MRADGAKRAWTEDRQFATLDPPWQTRKQAQLDRLRQADRHIAAIKTADAIHNLRATLHDLERQGDAVWQRFRGSKTEHLWYYTSLHEILRPQLGDHPLATELAHAIAELAQKHH